MLYNTLSRLAIYRSLQRLAELSAADHVTLELGLCHGAVIMVVYDEGTSISDQTHIVEATSRGEALIREVTTERKLPTHWLEEDVKFYLALARARHRPLDMFGPNLILSVFDTDHILAMKLRVCQDVVPPTSTDIADLGFLIGKMAPVSSEAVERLYARFFPGCSLNEAVWRLIGLKAEA